MFVENEIYFFLKKENPIFAIKLEQRLPKSFSELHVKNSRFFLSYFLKKDDWTKAGDSPLLVRIITVCAALLLALEFDVLKFS